MASGTPCLSRWDQSKSKADLLQGFMVNVSQSLTSQVASVSSTTGAPSTSTVVTTPQVSSVSVTLAPPNVAASGASMPGQDSPQGGVEMAAAMAAKINAMLMAKGKLKILQPLPCKIAPCLTVPSCTDELVVTEVDINDVPINCRNLLTKGKTQEEIRQYSGAVVSTKGLYMTNAEKSSSKGVERPLYLHVQGRSQEEVNKAVMRIKEIISEDVLRTVAGGQQLPTKPTLPVYPQQPVRPQVPAVLRPRNAHPGATIPQGQRPGHPHGQRSGPPHGHSGSFVHTKIFVGLEQALPSFNVNEKVEGPGCRFLQHVQLETGARVFLRGKSSGYIEQASRRESFEPLYLYISHPNSVGLEAAKKLCESLLETVRAEHTRMVSVYTATGSTQAYQALGYPANSNYSSQGSWYNYPSNGYTGGYSAYPGASGYWSSANGHPSHSNISTTPQSSQAMVQYPVCPRKPPPYLVQDQGTGCDGSESPPHSGSPKRRFLEDSDVVHEHEPGGGLDVAPKEAPTTPPVTSEGKSSERTLMPPPPAPFRPPPPPAPSVTAARKRPRETVSQDDDAASTPGVADAESMKKLKLPEDASGLVPYGGDSSDEEEEKTRSSKKANS